MAKNSIDLGLIDETLEKYAPIAGSLVTILQKTQAIYGYLPHEAMAKIAVATGIAPSVIMGVATFYTQFRFQQIGKYLILLCQGTACHVNRSERIKGAICDELNIASGGTTPDGLFTLHSVACLGCCSLAPAMMINDKAYGSLTPDKTRQILRKIQKKEETNS